MESTNSIVRSMLDTLAAKLQQGETSLVVHIKPDLIKEAMDALQVEYKTLFAPVIAGQTDTAAIYSNYERMRQAFGPQPTALVIVECQTKEEFSEAIGRMPRRHSYEWRDSFNAAQWDAFSKQGI